MYSDIASPPEISKELVEYLQQVFPNRLPSDLLTMSDRQLGSLHGQEKVIQHLNALRLAQEEEPTHVL